MTEVAPIIETTKAYLAAKYPTLTEEQKTSIATSAVSRMILTLPSSPLLHPLDPLFPYPYPYSWRYGLGLGYPRYPFGGSSISYAPGVSDPGYLPGYPAYPHPAYGYLGMGGSPYFTSTRSARG